VDFDFIVIEHFDEHFYFFIYEHQHIDLDQHVNVFFNLFFNIEFVYDDWLVCLKDGNKNIPCTGCSCFYCMV